jgi:hypothetical protein
MAWVESGTLGNLSVEKRSRRVGLLTACNRRAPSPELPEQTCRTTVADASHVPVEKLLSFYIANQASKPFRLSTTWSDRCHVMSGFLCAFSLVNGASPSPGSRGKKLLIRETWVPRKSLLVF